MQAKTNIRLMTTIYKIARDCFFVVLIFAISSPCILAQGMGGRSMHNQTPPQTNDQAGPPPKHQNPFGIDSTPIEGVEARTAALENFIFGDAQKKLPLEKRVERLEKS